MSVACQQQYTIKVTTTGFKAYWKFDEAGDPRVDSVNGFKLSTFDGNPAGSSPGIIGSAAHFPQTGADMFNTVTPPLFNFPYNSNNISWTFWIKVNANATGGFFFYELTWGPLDQSPGSFTLGAFCESGPLPTLTIGTQNQNFLINLGTLTLGKWFFVAVTYNQSTNTISASLNNGIAVNGVPNIPFSTQPGLAVDLTMSGAGYDILVDESFIGSGTLLSPTQLAKAFGGGTPPSWPWTFL